MSDSIEAIRADLDRLEVSHRDWSERMDRLEAITIRLVRVSADQSADIAAFFTEFSSHLRNGHPE